MVPGMGDVRLAAGSPPRVQNRWLVVVAAIILNLALGALYSWPVFANFLVRSLPVGQRWTNLEAQLVFSMATVFLAVGVIGAGQIAERRPPRALIVLSAICTGGGYILGGVLPLEPFVVTATIGVMVGFGIGVAYALPISLAAKWFPDRKGLVTGLAMAGFGVGSVLWSQVFDLFLSDRVGIRGSFVVYGIVFAAMILLTARFLIDPPEMYAEAIARRSAPGTGRWRLVALRTDKRRATGPRPAALNLDHRQILRRPQLYLLTYTFVVGSAVGLAIIGMSKTYPIERLIAAGLSADAATNITRIAALLLFPIFNGNGRVIFGWLSDHLGWKPVVVGSYFLQATIVLLFPKLTSSPTATLIALPLLAMCYGGNFTIFPVATGSLWGYRHLAANYSVVFIAFGVGALIGPPLSGAAKDAGVLEAAFGVAAALLALGAVFALLLKEARPENEETSSAAPIVVAESTE